MYAKPNFTNLKIIDYSYCEPISQYEIADFSPKQVSREEWIASMDMLENNAWQTLHLTEEFARELQPIGYTTETTKHYNFLPMIAAIITMTMFTIYMIG